MQIFSRVGVVSRYALAVSHTALPPAGRGASFCAKAIAAVSSGSRKEKNARLRFMERRILPPTPPFWPDFGRIIVTVKGFWHERWLDFGRILAGFLYHPPGVFGTEMAQFLHSFSVRGRINARQL